MTNEELAKSILMELEGGYISYGNFHGNNEQGLNLIKSAIEKQIPMGDDDTMECPRCHVVEFGYLRPKYCDNCGQRIADWSEVN